MTSRYAITVIISVSIYYISSEHARSELAFILLCSNIKSGCLCYYYVYYYDSDRISHLGWNCSRWCRLLFLHNIGKHIITITLIQWLTYAYTYMYTYIYAFIFV